MKNNASIAARRSTMSITEQSISISAKALMKLTVSATSVIKFLLNQDS